MASVNVSGFIIPEGSEMHQGKIWISDFGDPPYTVYLGDDSLNELLEEFDGQEVTLVIMPKG